MGSGCCQAAAVNPRKKAYNAISDARVFYERFVRTFIYGRSEAKRFVRSYSHDYSFANAPDWNVHTPPLLLETIFDSNRLSDFRNWITPSTYSKPIFENYRLVFSSCRYKSSLVAIRHRVSLNEHWETIAMQPQMYDLQDCTYNPERPQTFLRTICWQHFLKACINTRTE